MVPGSYTSGLTRGPGAPISESQLNGEAPVAPWYRKRRAADDGDLERHLRLDLEPVSGPDAWPADRRRDLQHDALAGPLFNPGAPQLERVVSHRDKANALEC